MASSCSKKIIQTTSNTFCCPSLQFVPYEICLPLRITSTGTAAQTILDMMLREVVGITIISSEESTATCTIDGGVSLSPGNSVSLLGQRRVCTIAVPTNGLFIGKMCVKIYSGIPI